MENSVVISLEEISEICRVCLVKGRIQPFTANLLEFYTFLANLKENTLDMPQNICTKCASYLESILTFVEKCKSNEYFLKRTVEVRRTTKDDTLDGNYNDDSSYSILKSQQGLDENESSELHDSSTYLDESLHCVICDKSFNAKLSFTNHMRVHKTHRERKQYLCYFCGKNFTKNSHLERHILSHTGTKPHKCQNCGKCFAQSNDLKRHLLTHTREKVFQCLHCDKAFHQKSCLNNHLQTHNNERSFQCFECEKRFAKKAYLAVHTRTHTGHKPYRCQTCDKRFHKKSSLNNHLLTHDSEKRHECIVCTKKFVQSNHLKEHLRIHSGEKPFVCSYCGKKFAYSSTLKVHLRQHTGEMPFVCSLCNRGFHDNSNWRRHVRRHSRSGIVLGERGDEVTTEQS